MAHLPVIANVYRVFLKWSAPGGLSGGNVMHFLKASSSASAVATSIDANVTTNMWFAQHSNTTVTELHVTPLDGSSATYVLATTGAKWGGGTGTGDLVPQASNICSLRTALRGRSQRGRLYLPFPTETAIAAGFVIAGNVTAGQTAWNTFLTAMTAAGTQLVVASYKLAGANTVTSVLCESVLGTQRRRQSRLR